MKIFQFLLLLLLFFGNTFFTFAQSQIQLNVPSVGAVGKEFALTATLQGTGNLEIKEMEIAGMQKDFTLMSQSSQTSMMILNGVSKNATEYTFGFIPQHIGTFRLGPVRIVTGSGEIISETRDITITQDTNNIAVSSPQSDLPHDIFGPQSVFQTFKYILIPLVIFLIIGSIILFFLKKYFTPPKEMIPPEKLLTQKEIYTRKLLGLQKESQNLNRFDFYTRLNSLLKEYFYAQGLKNALHFTYDDIIHDPFYIQHFSGFTGFLATSYFHEFSSKKDDMESRKNLIENIIGEIQK